MRGPKVPRPQGKRSKSKPAPGRILSSSPPRYPGLLLDWSCCICSTVAPHLVASRGRQTSLHLGDFATLCRSHLEDHFLHLVQTHDIRAPVIELGRPRALMCRHLLRFLQIPAIGQVNGDAGCPEGVTADFGLNTGPPRSPADHVDSIFPGERTL